MVVEMLVQNNKSGDIHNVSELVGNVNISRKLASEPGKLTFDFRNDGTVAFYEGSFVSLKVDGVSRFYGNVFTKKRNSSQLIGVTAYDQLRYLKNKDTYVFTNITADGIFTRICTDFKLKMGRIDKSAYVLPAKVQDDKSLGDMIQHGIDVTVGATKKWYMIRDNGAGELEFLDLATLKTNLVIGDESLLGDYDYESSIDSDTYNQVKLMNEYSEKDSPDDADKKKEKKRDIYIVKDSSTIKDWGILQLTEKVNGQANAAQLQERADALLSQKNRVTRKLSLKCIGDWRVDAGNGIFVSIKKLGDISLNQYMLITGCSHSMTNNCHLMDVEVELVV